MGDNNILIGPYNVRELYEVAPMNRIPRGKFVDGLLNETVPRPRLVFPTTFLACNWEIIGG